MQDPQYATDPDRYWAAAETNEDLASEMCARIKDYYEACDEYGRMALWRRSTRLYYGLDPSGTWADSSKVTYGGEEGEVVLLRVNHYRSFIQHVHTLVTGSRPALQARAGNDRPDTYERTIFAQSLLEFYFRKLAEAQVRKAALFALYWGEGCVYQYWDPNRGPEFSVDPLDPTKTTREGDLRVLSLRPIDVIRSPQAVMYDLGTCEWYIVRRKENRWNLAALFPDFLDEIKNAASAQDAHEQELYERRGGGQERGADYVYVYELWHDRTPAMPDGRYAMMVGDTVLTPGFMPLPYAQLPLHFVRPDDEEDTPFGYTPMFDCMGLQEAYDSVISTMITAHDVSGLPNYWTRTNDKLKTIDLAGGLRNVQSDEKPEIIKFDALSDASIRLEAMIQTILEKITGVNSVVRGDPQASLKSGSSLALVQAQAVQYNSGYQAAFSRLIENVGQAMLELLRANVKVPRVASISGESQVAAARVWTGKDFNDISSVVVEIGNPSLQTAQGRKALADEWAERQWLEGPEQYAQVMDTGRAQPVYKRRRDEGRLIGAENERLRNGQPVKAAYTDTHTIHIREHTCVLADPDIRLDDNIAGPTLEHIQEHVDMLKASDPILLHAIGDPLAELVMQTQMPPPPPPGGPPPEGAPPGEPEPPVSEAPPEGAQQPNMPEMPVNPLTGERVPSPTGG